MRRIFKTRHFSRWMRKTELTDELLCKAIEEMQNGLIDAHLGSNVVKKRIALPGRGKRGSTRTLIATNLGDAWFFLFGFAKNERDNISNKELLALQKLAADLLAFSALDLDKAIQDQTLLELCHDHTEHE